MSRLDEVEAEIADLDDSYSARTYTDGYADLARTIAAEVDELRGKLDDVRMGIGCARGQRSTQFCAEAAQRDEVITKLLAQFGEITCDPSCGITWTCTRCKAYARTLAAEVDARDEVITKLLAMLKTTHSKARYTDLRIRQLYEQACEIAGRTE